MKDIELFPFGSRFTDEAGNEVFGSEQEIVNGYGYFELFSMSEDTPLRKDVDHYDFQIEYTWNDPRGDVVHDGSGIGDEERVVYSVDGDLVCRLNHNFIYYHHLAVSYCVVVNRRTYSTPQSSALYLTTIWQS